MVARPPTWRSTLAASCTVPSIDVPGAITISIRTILSPPDGNSVTGMSGIRARLAATSATATAMVTALCESAHLSTGAYARCIQLSVSTRSSSSLKLTRSSEGRNRYAPSTGIAVSATTRDATRAKLTATANGKKNEPTSPSRKMSGTNTAMVVSVEAVMAEPTSTVACSAARHRSRPPWICR